MVRWVKDRGLQLRMIGTMFLLALVYFIFIAVLAYIGIDSLLLFVIVMGAILLQYFFSDRMVLLSMGARVVSEQEEPRLYETLTRLCSIAGIPRPKLAIVNSPIPNAFATGRNTKNSVVAVTTGLRSTLNQDEIEAVLAHELSHVKNRDVMVMTLASLISTAAFFIFRNSISASRVSSGRGGKQNLWFIIPVFAAAVWVISYLLIKALSRYREFSADRGSAVLTGRPSQLASALMKISGMMDRVPKDDLRKVEGMNAFFIIPALSGSSIMALFATHPSVEQRIAALDRIEKELAGRGD
ncbi:MAG TPA: zinc metalloprotease HtpX [Methanoregulaceae archaeon]|nr:zinc metalloprotease HtpX [Methanoregulaceae archaeon]HOH81564.1 zinc metalloprotease HtpX [Methanoregulaceae archaeon]